MEIAVQVNGKVKARLKVAADITAEDAIATAKADPAVADALAGKTAGQGDLRQGPPGQPGVAENAPAEKCFGQKNFSKKVDEQEKMRYTVYC